MKLNDTPSAPKTFLAGLSVLLIAIAGSTALWTWQTEITSESTHESTQKSSSLRLQPAELSPQLYWLEVVDNRIQLTPKKTTYPTATSPEIALKEALNNLFEQSPDSGLTTTIPSGTRLLDLRVSPAGIYVDLSQEFSQGGGSTSMIYRVAQVLYTATSLSPRARVFLSLEGQPLNEEHPLGGEGLLLSYPLTRQEFNKNFSLD